MKPRKMAAAATVMAALAFATLDTGSALAADDTTSAPAGWRLRGQVRMSGSGASEARSLPGAAELLNQGACHRGEDILLDGAPTSGKVQMTLWRQSGPTEEYHAKVPTVDCGERAIRASAFNLDARVSYPKEPGKHVSTGAMSLDQAIQTSVRLANKIAPRVLESGEEAVISIRMTPSQKRVPQMIRSLSRRHGVDGETAIRVASCESGMNPRAYSPPYAGVYQHHMRMWPGRARHYGHSGASPFDPYANVDVALRMVKNGGWDPWGCA